MNRCACGSSKVWGEAPLHEFTTEDSGGKELLTSTPCVVTCRVCGCAVELSELLQLAVIDRLVKHQSQLTSATCKRSRREGAD